MVVLIVAAILPTSDRRKLLIAGRIAAAINSVRYAVPDVRKFVIGAR